MVTASRTGIALSYETCLLGAVSLPVLCWFHLQQIPELNLMAPRLLPHFRTIIPFLPTNPNLANVPDKESGEDSMSRLHYRQECSIIHKQKLLGATSNTILVLCLSSFLLQLLCGFDLRLLLALLAHLLLKMERNDPVVREGRVCHGRGQQRRASLPPDAGLSPAERAGLAWAQHV